MLEWIIDIDKKLLLTINSWNTPWLDSIMMALTHTAYWLPFFILIIAAMIYYYRWHSLVILGYLILVIVLADQLSSSLLKPFVGRLRPSHDPELENMLHLVNNYRGGLYGFVSSHAANAFGIATLLFIALRQRIRWIWIMFIWALLFSYTRMYLGVHYPLDILCGGLLGGVISILLARLGSVMPKKLQLKQLPDGL